MAGSSDWKVPPGVQPKPAGLPLRSRARAVRRRRRLGDGAGRRLHGPDARHRARRQRRPDRRTASSLTIGYLDHRGASRSGSSPATAAPCRATSSATTRRRASASCRRSAGSTCRRWRSAIRRPPALASASSSRAPAGGTARSRRGSSRKQEFAGYWEYVLDEAIFTAPGPSALGRHGADRTGRRPHRHRLAAAPACRRGRPARPPQHGRADRPPEADPRRSPDARPAEPPAAALARAVRDRGRRQGRWWSASPTAARPSAPTSRRRRDPCGRADRSCATSPASSARVWSLGHAGVEVPLTI